MSLYFDDCVKEEQIAGDSDKDKIVFTFPWIIDIQAEVYENGVFEKEISVNTNYNVQSTKWKLCLTNYYFKVQSYELFRLLYESNFYISYKLYSDNEMSTEIFSSERIPLTATQFLDTTYTPEGAMKEFCNAFKQRKLAKVVIFVEFILLKKYFMCPLDTFKQIYERIRCEKMPDDLDSDFRFEFLKESDFIFKCRDGDVPAIKMVLNVSSSSFLKKELKKHSTGMELLIDHLSDVVKPIITFIHSGCFDMPKDYDLDFADRLLKALDFFELEKEYFKIYVVIHHSLFQKFNKEPHDFELILQWASLSSRHSLDLFDTIPVIIANKYYYKWLEKFAENERNSENLMLQNFFGSFEQAFFILKKVEDNFMSLFFINTIMP